MTGPRLVRWNRPSEKCQGCAGCSIKRALAERDTFSRGEVAHLLALAFRSGAQLSHDMAEDVTRWAADPLVVRTAGMAYRARRAAMDAGAERRLDRIAAFRPGPVVPGLPEGLTWQDDWESGGLVVDPDVAWPEVAVPGGAGGPR
jgi:hypothetical protein